MEEKNVFITRRTILKGSSRKSFIEPSISTLKL